MRFNSIIDLTFIERLLCARYRCSNSYKKFYLGLPRLLALGIFELVNIKPTCTHAHMNEKLLSYLSFSSQDNSFVTKEGMDIYFKTFLNALGSLEMVSGIAEYFTPVTH